ncbi:MAG: hypothetical protein ACFFD9_10090, partial [Candidatus Thorarchaeota archaeon]
VGIAPWTYALVKQPKLAYVLPSRALRLTVIDMKSGCPLFDYAWSKIDEVLDDVLFSGMLQGIGLILDESLKSGGVREIRLETAVLLLQRIEQSSLAVVLVATKSAQSLRSALKSFSQSFLMHFSHLFNHAYEINRFHAASELVKEHFAFVPNYD